MLIGGFQKMLQEHHRTGECVPICFMYYRTKKCLSSLAMCVKTQLMREDVHVQEHLDATVLTQQ